MTDEQLLRHSRHILLDEIGVEGQQRIAASHALVIGAGGLGSPVALYLAAAGVGTITLVDHDRVDLTNLQRQIAHTTGRVGELKVESAAQAMRALNPDVRIVALPERADQHLLARLAPGCDVVVDCSDNFATRQAVNAACVRHARPLVAAAAIRFEAQLSVHDTRDSASPCYACMFPHDSAPEEAQCATMGVFAPLVGMAGSMQAGEVLKLLCGAGKPAVGRLLMCDALSMAWTELRVPRDLVCPVCSSR